MLMMALPVKCWNIAADLMQKLGSFSFCHEIKCFFKLYLNLNLTLKLDEHKTRHTYLTINIWLSTFSTFSSLRVDCYAFADKKGGNAWSCFFDLSHDLFVLIYTFKLQAYLQSQAKSQIVPGRLGQQRLEKWNQASKIIERFDRIVTSSRFAH